VFTAHSFRPTMVHKKYNIIQLYVYQYHLNQRFVTVCLTTVRGVTRAYCAITVDFRIFQKINVITYNTLWSCTTVSIEQLQDTTDETVRSVLTGNDSHPVLFRLYFIVNYSIPYGQVIRADKYRSAVWDVRCVYGVKVTVTKKKTYLPFRYSVWDLSISVETFLTFGDNDDNNNYYHIN